ncbi:MAG: IS4 family transposase [Gemmataceae bacterium]
MPARSSYPDDLPAAIRTWLPAPFFSSWTLRRGLCWTPQRLVWLAILLVWSAEQTLADRFDAAVRLLRDWFPRWSLGDSYTGFSAALGRWSDTLQPAVAARLRQQMARLPGRRLRHGWPAFAVDGSRVECPRTAANQAAFGCAGKKRTAPQLFLTTLWDLGTGLPWDYRIGPGTASERRHLESMLADLPAGALVVADAGFVGYDLCQRILASGRSFLLRVGANIQLLRELGAVVDEDEATVYLWPGNRRCQPPLVLRLIVLPGDKKGKVYLLTNVRDEAALSDTAAAELYRLRWGVEVFYRGCKQTLQRRKMLSRAPAQAKAELGWTLVGVWLLGLMSVSAILAAGGDPLSWSVALARKTVRRAMRPTGGSRRQPPLQEQLAAATQDEYERRGSKQARDWPHKKREKGPGAPKIRAATADEVQRATRFQSKRAA